MKVTIFSDIHGNLPAFEQVLKLEDKSDLYVCLGDVVNYGPWSNECVALMENLHFPKICLRGNHEDYFIEGHYQGRSDLGYSFFQICSSDFIHRDVLLNYQETYELANHHFAHTIDNKYIYPDTPLSLDANFFIGHSHHQFMTTSNGYQLYNVGSVGQNRKYINLISYVNWYPEDGKIDLKNIKYDIKVLITEMKVRQYPAVCIDYYQHKAML